MATLQSVARDQEVELWVFLVLAMTTATRKSEILRRRWDEVQLEGPNSYLRVPVSKNGDSKNLILTRVVVEALKQLPSFGRKEYLFPSRPTTRFSCPAKPYRWDMGKPFQKARQTAEIKNLRIHDLRHAVPSILLEKGVPDDVVRKLTGHRSRKLERDQHLSPGFRQQTAELIADTFLEEIPEQSPGPRTAAKSIGSIRKKIGKLKWRGRRDSNSRPPA